MRTRTLLSAAAVFGAVLLAPAAGQARPRARQVRLKDHCIVVKLPAGAKLSVCYPT